MKYIITWVIIMGKVGYTDQFRDENGNPFQTEIKKEVVIYDREVANDFLKILKKNNISIKDIKIDSVQTK